MDSFANRALEKRLYLPNMRQSKGDKPNPLCQPQA